jgi:hypothetical protein
VIAPRVRPLAVQASRACGVACALVLLAVTTPAHARTTIVPDDFPTIQAALDAIAIDEHVVPDTVLVRPGDYPEVIVVEGGILLRGMDWAPGVAPTVRIAGLQTGYGWIRRPVQRFEGLHFTGPAALGYLVNFSFLDCRFDADLAPGFEGVPDYVNAALRRCEVFGTTRLNADVATVDSCTFHGHVVLDGYYGAHARDNRMELARDGSLTVIAELGGSVLRNRIRGGGISAVVGDDDMHVSDNHVEGTGVGIQVVANNRGAILERNVVSKVTGVGIRAYGVTLVRANRVLDCAANGYELELGDDDKVIEGNIAGRCGGHGIVVKHYPWVDGDLSVKSNTSFACGGAGLWLHEPPLEYGSRAARVTGNLSCFNFGPGFAFWGAALSEQSCNDWFANDGGPTLNVTPSPTDLGVDPRLCGGTNGDGALRSDSPLLNAAACGRIGAPGDCEAPVLVVGFELWPRVLQPTSRSRWVTAWLEPPAGFMATDIEPASVTVNGVPAATGSETIGDRDRDGIPELQVRVERTAIEQTFARGEEQDVTVSGRIGRRQFTGTDEIRVLRHGGPHSSVPREVPRVLSIQAPPLDGASGLRVAFTLVETSPARLDVLDVAGRVVASHEVTGREPGEHTLELAGRGGFAPGIYFLRLRQGASEARTRVVVVR